VNSYLRNAFASSCLRHSGKLRVGWIPYELFDTSEPGFRHSIERVIKHRGEHFTGVEELARRAAEQPALPVTFIFHVSHCGSTLFANACKHITPARVISEPPILGPRQLLRPLRDAETGLPASKDFHEALIRGAVNSFVNGGPDARYVVIKLMSLASLFLPMFRRIFPSSYFIFLYRDPGEVIPKLLRAVDEPLRESRMPLIRYALGKPRDWNPPAASCWASVYEAQCIAATITPGVIALDYRDLTPDRAAATIRAAGMHADIDVAALTQTFAIYSKDASRKQPFAPERPSTDATEDILHVPEFKRAKSAYERISASSRTSSDRIP